MKARQVKVGKVYAVKVGQRIVPVRIDRTDDQFGGWWGTNLSPLKGGKVTVRIPTAGKLRFECIKVGGNWVRGTA